MNRLTIIGNLVRPPELRTTQSGISVCSFTVAVNRRRTGNGQPEADFFNVSVWRELGETCAKYLAKGRKVAVVGSVSVRSYTNRDGNPGATMEVLASEVEFLSPREEQQAPKPNPAPVVDQQTGMQQVTMDDDLPF